MVFLVYSSHFLCWILRVCFTSLPESIHVLWISLFVVNIIGIIVWVFWKCLSWCIAILCKVSLRQKAYAKTFENLNVLKSNRWMSFCFGWFCNLSTTCIGRISSMISYTFFMKLLKNVLWCSPFAFLQ